MAAGPNQRKSNSMSIALVKRAPRRGFTLLEVTLAVAILGMMAMVIYRFVATNLTIMRVSAEEDLVERESPRQAFSAPHNKPVPAVRSGPSNLPSMRHWSHDTSPRPVRSFLTARISIPRAAPPRLRLETRA